MENCAMNERNDAFLSLRHVEKVYANGEKAVYDFNLEIKKNEFIVIVGPSGCGKSTTLRMIAGLEDVTDGDIVLEDELLNFKPINERQMAMVFQSYALYPQMSVYENIAFPLEINKVSAPVVNEVLASAASLRALLLAEGTENVLAALGEILAAPLKKRETVERVAIRFEITCEAAERLIALHEEDGANGDCCLQRLLDAEAAERARLDAEGIRVNEAFEILDEAGEPIKRMRHLTPFEIKKKVYRTAEILNLTSFLDKLPKELSGGQMQRVALGRAIVKNVPIFLMDEPLSNLDAKLRYTMRSEIVKLHNRIGATTIYVTHDQTEAMTMATRIVVMSRGFIQQIGTPEEIYQNPHNVFVAKFVGVPAMNFFDVPLRPQTGELLFEDTPVHLGDELVARCLAFYEEKVAEFTAMQANFDAANRVRLLRILSGMGEAIKRERQEKKRGGVSRLIARLRKQEETVADPAETILAEKLDTLRAYVGADALRLHIGIRPERLTIEKYDPDGAYENAFITKPTVCELLGGSYNVHFSLCGQDVVGVFDAREAITPADTIAVRFDPKDLYAFDAVTGERIW